MLPNDGIATKIDDMESIIMRSMWGFGVMMGLNIEGEAQEVIILKEVNNV